MPEHILVEEMFDDLIEEIAYIKLKAHIKLQSH